jgi:hypothetical protein
MKKLLLLALCLAVFATIAMAQVTYAPGTVGGIGRSAPVDKLGAHNNNGRGCAGCHAPHSGFHGNGGNAGTYTGTNAPDPNAGNDALWGEDLTPLYGYTLAMGDNGQYVETLPTEANFAVGDEEIRGIMMCLSCHDGNIAKGAMMQNRSWEQANGLLPVNAYGPNDIPTLLGNDGTTAGNYNNDHPVGVQATLKAVGVSSRFTVTTCGTAPNTFACLTTADAAYLEFMGNYGAFQLIPGRASFVAIPEGAVTADTAYVVCTTCHTPHTMYTYKAGTTTGTKVGLGNSTFDTAGVYPTYFFINAPYNPGAAPPVNQASSATQFCRQCHFSGAGGSNEASGIHNVTTQY